MADRDASAPAAASHDGTTETPDDRLEDLLRSVQVAFLKYPMATRAAMAAFVAEGRRFAATEEGRRWKAALADSRLVRRGRVLWEGFTLNLLQEDEVALLPSALLELVLMGAATSRLERVMARISIGGDDEAHR